jgi:hypothetical protein
MIAVIATVAALALAPAQPPTGAAAAAAPNSAAAVADGELQAARGGSAIPSAPAVPLAVDSALSLQTLSGLVAGNTVVANTVQSGAINFDGQALSNFSGVGNFILNTGMNSLLQGSVNVTVNLVGAR